MDIENKKQKRAGNREPIWNSLRSHTFPRKKHTLEEVKAAARAHEQGRVEQASAQDGATGKSEYLGNLVYGGLDGIITTFAVVSGVAGASLSPEIILILGLSNLLADGLSMATGAYLSARSEQEVYAREREHISEQIVQHPEKEKAALVQGYRQQGYPEEEARQLTEIISRDPGRWVSTAMAEKLLLLPQKRKPVLEGVAAFVAFAAAGAIPLLVFFADLLLPFSLSITTAFLWTMALSAAALFGLGAAKVFVTRGNALRSGIQMLVVGSLAGLVAFAVGTFLKSLVGPAA